MRTDRSADLPLNLLQSLNSLATKSYCSHYSHLPVDSAAEQTVECSALGLLSLGLVVGPGFSVVEELLKGSGQVLACLILLRDCLHPSSSSNC